MEQIIINKAGGGILNLKSNDPVIRVTKASQKVELLGADTVNISVESSAKLQFTIGDSINVIGRLYTLNTPALERKLSESHFIYEMEFEGVQYDLLRASYSVNVNTTNNEIQDISGDSLTGDLKRFLDVLISNANRVFPGIWVLGTYPSETETKTLSFSDTDSCLTVLQSLCSEDNYNTEFYIDLLESGVKMLNVGPTGNEFPFTLEYGKGKGVYELTRQKVSSSNIITRLNVFGGSRNINTSKYRAFKLCLPGKNKGESYVEDSVSKSKYGVWESTKNFDDIYPSRIGSVTALGDSELKFIDSSMNFDLNELDPDGVTTKYIIAGSNPKVHFNTGNLAGYEFELKYNHTLKEFTLIPFTDENGYTFPSSDSEAFQIKIGDQYVITEIYLPDTYITDAEAKLQTKGIEYLLKYSQPLVTYAFKADSMFLNDIMGGAEENVFWPGDYIPIKDTDLEVDKQIRLKDFTRDLLKDYSYEFTISDLPITTSNISRVISSINSVNKIVKVNNLADVTKARRSYKTSDEVLNFATQSSEVAQQTANIAQSTANTAISVASSAQGTASSAASTASVAQLTANSKRRNFTSTPTTPYEIGDLWSQGTSGEIMKCKTTRLTGGFYAGDWEKASKYTDDTAVNNLQVGGRNYILDSESEKEFSNTLEIPLTMFSGGETISFSFFGKYAESGTESWSFLVKNTGTGSDGTTLLNINVNEHVYTYKYGTITLPSSLDNLRIVCFNAGAYVSHGYIKLIKAEKGNKVTDWTPAPEDVNGKISALDYLKAALAGSTEIEGGLVGTNVVLLKTLAGAITAGMSGLSSDNIGFWAGGTYDDALVSLAKIILRKDGSGQLAGGKINWDAAGSMNIGMFNIFSNLLSSGNIAFTSDALENIADIPGSTVNVSIPSAKTANQASNYTNTITSSNFTAAKNSLLKFRVDQSVYMATAGYVTLITKVIDNATGLAVNMKNESQSSQPNTFTNNYDYSLNIAPGTYHIEITLSVSNSNTANYETITVYAYGGSGSYITVNPLATLTKLASDGFYSYWGSTAYLYLRTNYGFEVRFGNYGIQVTTAGVKKYNGSSWVAVTW